MNPSSSIEDVPSCQNHDRVEGTWFMVLLPLLLRFTSWRDIMVLRRCSRELYSRTLTISAYVIDGSGNKLTDLFHLLYRIHDRFGKYCPKGVTLPICVERLKILCTPNIRPEALTSTLIAEPLRIKAYSVSLKWIINGPEKTVMTFPPLCIDSLSASLTLKYSPIHHIDICVGVMCPSTSTFTFDLGPFSKTLKSFKITSLTPITLLCSATDAPACKLEDHHVDCSCRIPHLRDLRLSCQVALNSLDFLDLLPRCKHVILDRLEVLNRTCTTDQLTNHSTHCEIPNTLVIDHTSLPFFDELANRTEYICPSLELRISTRTVIFASILASKLVRSTRHLTVISPSNSVMTLSDMDRLTGIKIITASVIIINSTPALAQALINASMGTLHLTLSVSETGTDSTCDGPCRIDLNALCPSIHTIEIIDSGDIRFRCPPMRRLNRLKVCDGHIPEVIGQSTSTRFGSIELLHLDRPRGSQASLQRLPLASNMVEVDITIGFRFRADILSALPKLNSIQRLLLRNIPIDHPNLDAWTSITTSELTIEPGYPTVLDHGGIKETRFFVSIAAELNTLTVRAPKTRIELNYSLNDYTMTTPLTIRLLGLIRWSLDDVHAFLASVPRLVLRQLVLSGLNEVPIMLKMSDTADPFISSTMNLRRFEVLERIVLVNCPMIKHLIR